MAFWACIVTIPDLAGQPDANIISRLDLNADKASISSLAEHTMKFVIFPDGSKGLTYKGMTFVRSKVVGASEK
jgi:hypothetical protein